MSYMYEMRIGDGDRDKTREHLSDMFSKGYLTEKEFHDRCDRVNAATTQGQLDKIVVDLPAAPVISVVIKKEKVTIADRVRKVHPSFRALAFLPLTVALAVVPSTTIAAMTHGLGNSGLGVGVATFSIVMGAVTTLITIVAAVALSES